MTLPSLIKSRRGFTLVETLVAILALSLSLGALTLLTARSVTNARTAELRFTAEFLATEGIEIMKQHFMTSMLQNPNTFDADVSTLLNSSCSSGSCTIDDDDFVTFSPSDCPYDPASADVPTCDTSPVFSYGTAGALRLRQSGTETGGTATSFWRLIFVDQPTLADPSIFVRSVVWYKVPGSPLGKIEMTTEIKNWYLPTSL